MDVLGRALSFREGEVGVEQRSYIVGLRIVDRDDELDHDRYSIVAASHHVSPNGS